MRDSLKNLPGKLLQFIEVHERFVSVSIAPTDEKLAKELDITRATVINRRRTIREMGVDLPSLAPRGYQRPSHPGQLFLFA